MNRSCPYTPSSMISKGVIIPFLTCSLSARINAEVRRIGGGYGGKITNPIPIASACAVAATKLNKPVRLVLDIEDMMEMCSGRYAHLISYEVRSMPLYLMV